MTDKFTDTEVTRLIMLGWQFVPTGPEEWEWVLFDAVTRCSKARQGDEQWRQAVRQVKRDPLLPPIIETLQYSNQQMTDKELSAMTETLKPFTTDGCSGGMSWLWRLILRRPPPWEGDCEAHDRLYHMGGTKAARLYGDRKLASRVAMRGYPIIAAGMYYAVRIGGHPWLPLPWRWGYGYKWPRGYRTLLRDRGGRI